MTTNTTAVPNEANRRCPRTAGGHGPGDGAGDDWRDVGLGLLRESGEGLYTPGGYASLINYYIKKSHSPAAWKAVMGLAASHAAMAALPCKHDRDLSRRSPGHRSCSPARRPLWLSVSRQPVGLGVGHVVDLGTAGSGARIACALIGRAGRAWGIDAWLAQRWPSSPWW